MSQQEPRWTRVTKRHRPVEPGEHPSLQEYIGRSKKTAWRWVRDKKVRSAKVGGVRLVDLNSVDKLLARRAEGGDMP